MTIAFIHEAFPNHNAEQSNSPFAVEELNYARRSLAPVQNFIHFKGQT